MNEKHQLIIGILENHPASVDTISAELNIGRGDVMILLGQLIMLDKVAVRPGGKLWHIKGKVYSSSFEDLFPGLFGGKNGTGI